MFSSAVGISLWLMLVLLEQTSGLDSFSAVQLCHVLKKVANAGASVLFTIHQPSSDIFSTFDYLILLNKGRVMYEGKNSSVPTYFAMKDYPMPPNYNPADWIMVRCSCTACLPCLHSVRFLPCSYAFLAIVTSNSMLRRCKE